MAKTDTDMCMQTGLNLETRTSSKTTKAVSSYPKVIKNVKLNRCNQSYTEWRALGVAV